MNGVDRRLKNMFNKHIREYRKQLALRGKLGLYHSDNMKPIAGVTPFNYVQSDDFTDTEADLVVYRQRDLYRGIMRKIYGYAFVGNLLHVFNYTNNVTTAFDRIVSSYKNDIHAMYREEFYHNFDAYIHVLRVC